MTIALDSDIVAGFGFPVFAEGRVVIHIKLTCRVGRHIEQRDERFLGEAGEVCPRQRTAKAVATALSVETLIKWRREVMDGSLFQKRLIANKMDSEKPRHENWNEYKFSS